MDSSLFRTLYVNCDETTLRSLLEKTSEECPTIGFKILRLPNSDSTFEVTVKSMSQTITNRAEAILRFLLPANAIECRFAPNSRQSIDRLKKYGSDNHFVKTSIELVSKALNEFKAEEILYQF